MKYKENYEISTHDVDVNNNVRPSFILKYMQETAMHQLRDRKPTYNELFDSGLSYVVTGMTIEYSDQLHQYDKIQGYTWSCPPKGATFIRCYELARGNDVAVRTYSTWAMNNFKTGKLCKTSEIDLSSYESGDPLEMNLPTRIRLPKDVELKEVGEETIKCSQVDLNLHMNNTNYPDMLWNYIPNIMDKKVTSLRIRFKKEAPLGSTLKVYMSDSMPPEEGDPNGKESYLFVTKINGEINVEAIFNLAPVEK